MKTNTCECQLENIFAFSFESGSSKLLHVLLPFFLAGGQWPGLFIYFSIWRYYYWWLHLADNYPFNCIFNLQLLFLFHQSRAISLAFQIIISGEMVSEASVISHCFVSESDSHWVPYTSKENLVKNMEHQSTGASKLDMRIIVSEFDSKCYILFALCQTKQSLVNF